MRTKLRGMPQLSKQDQYKTVSAGLALGLCMMERYEIPSGKLTVEFAFYPAWRKWGHAHRFPAVTESVYSTGPALDLYWILQEYDERKRTPWVPFYWDSAGPSLVIYARDGSDWDPDVPEDLDLAARGVTDSPVIPAEAWKDLARDFLAELDGDD